MSAYQIAILGLYSIAAMVCLNDRRMLSWISIGAGVFLATSAYSRAGGWNPAFMSALADGAVCLLIYAFGRYKWEMTLWRLFQTFLLVHIVFLAGIHGLSFTVPEPAYHSALEVINILVVLTIGGTGLLQRIGYDGIPFTAWHPVRRLVHFVRQERTIPPFWRRWA